MPDNIKPIEADYYENRNFKIITAYNRDNYQDPCSIMPEETSIAKIFWQNPQARGYFQSQAVFEVRNEFMGAFLIPFSPSILESVLKAVGQYEYECFHYLLPPVTQCSQNTKAYMSLWVEHFAKRESVFRIASLFKGVGSIDEIKKSFEDVKLRIAQFPTILEILYEEVLKGAREDDGVSAFSVYYCYFCRKLGPLEKEVREIKEAHLKLVKSKEILNALNRVVSEQMKMFEPEVQRADGINVSSESMAEIIRKRKKGKQKKKSPESEALLGGGAQELSYLSLVSEQPCGTIGGNRNTETNF